MKSIRLLVLLALVGTMVLAACAAPEPVTVTVEKIVEAFESSGR